MNVFSGRTSCARISIASMPPRTKNTNAVTRYRAPIRLWSTVPRNERTPGFSSQCCWRRSSTATLTGTSRQGFQVGEELMKLRLRELGGRHLVARLDPLRVEDPPRETPRRVRDRSGGEGVPRRHVREVGADRRARVGAADRVAVDARRSEEDLLAEVREAVALRLRGDGLLRRDPLLEQGSRLSDDLERHVRVLQPAVLRALP